MNTQPNPVYVFDLDGVITNPLNTQVSEEVVAEMYRLLERGTHLVVNTGRSYDWVEQNLVQRLEARNHPSIFTRFITVCEKGGETVSWETGSAVVRPSEFALAQESYDITKRVFDNHRSELKTMFWDATKRTMATTEKYPEASLDEFHAEQSHLVELLKQALDGHDVNIDATMIATDIESTSAGKYAGAQLIFDWVRTLTDSDHHEFICFGDSPSDYGMARYFAEQDAPTTFVYVGKPTDQITHDERVNLVHTEKLFYEGALEYLANI